MTDLVAQFETDFDKAGNKLLQMLTDSIGQLNRTGGNIEATQFNVDFMTRRLGSYIKVMKECGYTDVVDRLTAGMANTGKLIAGDTANSLGLGLNWADMDKSNINAIIQMQHDALTSIGSANISLIKSELATHIIAGTSEKSLISGIKSSIDGRFKRYATTYANTGIQLYNQKVSDITIESFGLMENEVDYRYVGVLDGHNRPECRAAYKQSVFTSRERSAFESKYGIRWNCRHKFMPIPKEDKNPAPAPVPKPAPAPAPKPLNPPPVVNPKAKDSLSGTDIKQLDKRSLAEFKKLTDNEVEAMRAYTGSGDFYALNDHYMNGTPLSYYESKNMERFIGRMSADYKHNHSDSEFLPNDYLTNMDKSLRSALDKSTKYDGTVSRVMNFKADKIDDFESIISSANNGLIEFKGYSSTTVDNLDAEWLNEWKYGQGKKTLVIEMRIKTKTGTYINPISYYGDQHEVLLPPGVKFKVTNIQELDTLVIDKELDRVKDASGTWQWQKSHSNIRRVLIEMEDI